MMTAVGVLMYASLGLLIAGSWTENFVLARMRQVTGGTRTNWKQFFKPTKQVVTAYVAQSGDMRLVRIQKLANACMFAGLAGIVSFVITACIWMKMH